MANTLTSFQPEFYAQEGLRALENAMGMSARLYRGFDQERKTFDKGETINIKRPGTFTVQDAPSTAQDIKTDGTTLVLSQWREVKFKLTDKEWALSEKSLIDEHIVPAAYAIANDMDQDACAMAFECGYYESASSPAVVSDLTAVRANMMERGVPVHEGINFMVSPTLEAELLNLTAFHQAQGAGDAGVRTQVTGMLGRKFGMDFFTNQNVQAKAAAGTHSVTGVQQVVGAHAKGATTLTFDGATALTGTLVLGDLVTVGNHTYAVLATATASGNAITVTIHPLREDIADNATVVVTKPSASAYENIAFHRNFGAIAFGKLPEELPRRMGALVSSIQSPQSNIALRARLYYVGNSSEIHVALDVLYGMKVLEPEFACRFRD